jgi:DNA-binding MarR family transcriptional regulator
MKIASCTEPQALAWQNFDRMRIRLIGQINRELTRETGLSEADFAILSELIHAQHETVRAMALRGGLDWEKSRLSHQIRRMEERGLLKREPCAEDQRGSDVRLTETGTAVALDAIERYAAIVRRHVFDLLTPAQIAALDDISSTVLMALESGDSDGCESFASECRTLAE